MNHCDRAAVNDWVFFLAPKMVSSIRNYSHKVVMDDVMSSLWSKRYGLMSSFSFIGPVRSEAEESA